MADSPTVQRDSNDRHWPHAMALLLVCATFPLIWVGGLVTTYDAGMAVPDWPSTYGYNLFLYPWQTWLFGPFDLFVEHGHRLLGALVGMIAIATVIVTWRKERRSWVIGFSIGLLALVVLQGGLGGLRVIENQVQLARVHGIVGPAFFACAVAFAVVTSKLWRTGTIEASRGGSKLQRISTLTAGLVFVQLILGAHLRHLPADWSPYAFRGVVVFHLFMAAALIVHVALLAIRVLRHHRRQRGLVMPAASLAVLLIFQIGLGSATWVVNYSWPQWVVGMGVGVGYTVQAGSFAQAMTVTAHQAMGSLILAFAVTLTLRSFRLLRTDQSTSIHPSVMLQGVLG